MEKIGKQTIDKVNKRRLLMQMKLDLENSLSKYILKDNTNINREEIRDITKDICNSYKEKGLLSDSDVSVRKCKWEDIYPSRVSKIWALICYRIVKLFSLPISNNIPKWYHRLFPYKIETLTDLDIGTLTDLDMNEDSDSCVIGDYYAVFETPFNRIISDINISPVKSIASIKLNYTICKSGAIFKN